MKYLLKKNWKRIIAGSLCLCLVIGLGIIFAIKYDIFYPSLTKQLQNKQKQLNKLDTTSSYEDMLDTYICMNNIHRMANAKIIAQDSHVWGRQVMSNDEIDMCIRYLLANPNIGNRINVNELIQYLIEWKSKDYSHSVEMHNMTWEYLGGTVGRAIKLKDK